MDTLIYVDRSLTHTSAYYHEMILNNQMVSEYLLRFAGRVGEICHPNTMTSPLSISFLKPTTINKCHKAINKKGLSQKLARIAMITDLLLYFIFYFFLP